jgi:hypothetical protein
MIDEGWDVSKLGSAPNSEPEQTCPPTKIRKRREHFVKMPWTWVERLANASGKTWLLAACLRYRYWQTKGGPIKLANGMLQIDGISRRTKWRALGELERLGLIAVERRNSRSPIIRLLG